MNRDGVMASLIRSHEEKVVERVDKKDREKREYNREMIKIASAAIFFTVSVQRADAEYNSACVQAYVLQQHGQSRDEPKDASVSDGAQRYKRHDGYIHTPRS